MKTVRIIKPKDRAEWLEHRTKGIGSSEVASILGLNPWETPYQLWRRKKGLDPQKTETFAMKAGHYLEDAVTMFWADETGREIIKSSAGDWLYVSTEKEYLRVSPDRTYWLAGMPKNNKNKGILECKTTQMTIEPDELPKHWFVQVQYQLGVSGFNQGALAWLSAGRDFGCVDMDFAPDFYAWMIEEVEKFWTNNIKGNEEPSLISADDILTKYSRHTDGKVIDVGDDILEAYSSLKDVRNEIAKLEDTKAELEEKIKLNFGDAEAISYAGQILATWKAPKESSKFDTRAFKKEHPELAEKYTKAQSGTRRFVLK